jgi:UDP-N-acetylmuramate dehydrogenase
MDAARFEHECRVLLAPEQIRAGAPMAPLTTFHVGGPADWLIEPATEDALRGVIGAAHRAGVPVTMIGGGSNVLVPDAGIRGAVIRPSLRQITAPRPGVVRAEAGVTINGLVRWTISRGLAGVQAWAGTPGTVGGAIAGNAHFKGRDIGDLVEAVGLLDRQGGFRSVPRAGMEFAYDTSRIKRTGEIVVWAEFAVGRGEVDALRAEARASLAFRKGTQPLSLASAGCIFQNPDRERDRVPEGIPASAGALVDRAGLKGVAVGGARISPLHANFIVNEGAATAADIKALIERARRQVRDKFGIELKDEIAMLGEWDDTHG